MISIDFSPFSPKLQLEWGDLLQPGVLLQHYGYSRITVGQLRAQLPLKY